MTQSDRARRMLQVCAVDFTAFHLLRTLMLGAREDGWDVTVACADGPFVSRLRDEGIGHWPIHMSRSVSPASQLRAIGELAARMRRDAPDLVHTHTPVGGLAGRAAALAWRGPVVHTFHGLPFEGERRSTTERAFLLVERLLARRTTFFFSQARGDAARAAALGIARPADTLVIGNGVDLARFAPDDAERAQTRAALALPAGAVCVLIVARLVREKGLLELADAALTLAGLPSLHVRVVGSSLPSDRTSVEAELDVHPVTRALGGRWRRLGHRDDVPALLRAGDVFGLPTYREGLPRSIIEAMAAALPVVATTIPACRELVREGETGLLVPPRDAGALADAIAALVADPARRTAMGARARAIAVAEHDESVVVRRQLEVFRRLLPA